MAKIIRQNLINTVRMRQYRHMAILLLCDTTLILAASLFASGGKLYAALLPIAVAVLLTRYMLRDIGIIRSGADGESETLARLRNLPSSYIVIPDCEIAHSGHRSQTDYIIVGPSSVLVLESKNVSGVISGSLAGRELNQRKYREGKMYEQKMMYNPLMQVRAHGKTLEKVLRGAGVQATVLTAVCFTNKNAHLRFEHRNIHGPNDPESLENWVCALMKQPGKKIDYKAVVTAVRSARPR